MGLMDMFVQEGDVEPAVDPVDAVVRKKQEPEELLHRWYESNGE